MCSSKIVLFQPSPNTCSHHRVTIVSGRISSFRLYKLMPCMMYKLMPCMMYKLMPYMMSLWTNQWTGNEAPLVSYTCLMPTSMLEFSCLTNSYAIIWVWSHFVIILVYWHVYILSTGMVCLYLCKNKPQYWQSTKPAEEVAKEIRLPQALERMLAFKDARVKEVGVKMEDLERLEKGELMWCFNTQQKPDRMINIREIWCCVCCRICQMKLCWLDLKV